jgi:AbrB family looped-hinge helix DNA binding protein
MTQVKLSSKYQIVIPEDVREQLGLKPGQLFEVFALDGQLVVAVPARPISESFGMFPGLDTSDPRDHEDRL